MAIATRKDSSTNRAKGKGYYFPIATTAQSGTAAGATSGFIQLHLLVNTIGSTLPNTIQSIPIPSTLANELFPTFLSSNNTTAAFRTNYLAYFYKIGTVDLANAAGTPYDGFTHDANWSGNIQRTYGGAASQNVPLVPILHITTATTVTAPAFILKATAGTAGYKNQANSGIVGTKTLTLPAAATAQGSIFVLRLEDGDSSICDVTQISVTTKGSAGAGNIYGMELIAPCTPAAGYSGMIDPMFSAFNMQDLNPAVASSGTVPSFLAVCCFGSPSATSTQLTFNAVSNI